VELTGKVAVVTGGGRGIGAAHALALAARGAKVVVNDLGVRWSGEAADESRAERLATEIRRRGGDAVHHQGDCSRWEDAEKLVHLALDRFGDFNILVLKFLHDPSTLAGWGPR
jgi:NAD(P)-dependent dehydrogenase (short-subunit alcohol dehydrogenase family)